MPSKGKLNREQAATVPAGECSRGKEHGRSQSRKRGPIQVTGKGFLEEDGEAKGEEVETGQRQGAGQREEEAGQREEADQANNEALSFCLKTLPFNFPEMKYNE